MSKFGKDLIESMTDAAAHARGESVVGMRMTTIELPDVKASGSRCTCRKIGSRLRIESRSRP